MKHKETKIVDTEPVMSSENSEIGRSGKILEYSEPTSQLTNPSKKRKRDPNELG